MNSVSRSPLTGKNYELPSEGHREKEYIQDFLCKHQGKPVVLVQGLGFVGGVMSLVCANSVESDYAVIGIDLPNEDSFWKIGSFREGVLPLSSTDPKVASFFENAKKKGNHLATFDSFAYSVADVVIVDINLDVEKSSDENGSLISFEVSLEAFKSAILTISELCKPDILIIIETTVPPGTTKSLVVPIIRDGLANRNLPNDQFMVGHSYERVMPGPNYIDSIQNFFRVYSGMDIKSADSTEAFLRTIIKTDEYPLTRLSNTNSTEIAKVLENSYRAANIAFMVEWSRFAEEAGVDIYEVVNAIRMRDTHKNMMLPGLGVGGYCLTKDPLLASWSKQEIFKSKEGLTQSEQGVRINDQMPLFAFQFFKEKLNSLSKEIKGLRVLLLGVSYRGDVADTRYSPVELFYNLLIKAQCKVRAHDYFVKHWEECSLSLENDLQNALSSEFDALVITTAHSDYRNNLNLMQVLEESSNLVIFDTVGLFSKSELKIIEQKNHLLVLGRGD